MREIQQIIGRQGNSVVLIFDQVSVRIILILDIFSYQIGIYHIIISSGIRRTFPSDDPVTVIKQLHSVNIIGLRILRTSDDRSDIPHFIVSKSLGRSGFDAVPSILLRSGKPVQPVIRQSEVRTVVSRIIDIGDIPVIKRLDTLRKIFVIIYLLVHKRLVDFCQPSPDIIIVLTIELAVVQHFPDQPSGFVISIFGNLDSFVLVKSLI